MDLSRREYLQFPEVQEAQAEASRHFVNMVELHQAVGRRLAELTGAESGLITSGAAGAMAAATAACMAGNDPQKIWQLPGYHWPEARSHYGRRSQRI